ncbi:hypothetical protein V6N13_037920 [Hibiscus sabdariffa]
MSTMTSSLEMEATLLSTGWWSRYSNDTSKRCKWSGDLSSLEHLDLSTNYLTGELPQSLEKLTRLRHLNLSYNYFEESDVSTKA